MKAYANSVILVNSLTVAESFTARLVGLLNKSNIEDEGLLLMNCSSIHCFFMKFTIDAIYLSNDMKVLDKETVSPWKLGKLVKKAKHVLELPEGYAKDIMIGDMIEFRE